MNIKTHYEHTLSFFKQIAVERQGYYDGNPKKLKHTFWQMRMRKMILGMISGFLVEDKNIPL